MPNVTSNSESDWELFLDENYCKKDRVGNRPCDNGVACDCCMDEAVEEQFDNWYANRIPKLTEKLIDKYHCMVRVFVTSHTKPKDYPIFMLQHMYNNGIVPVIVNGGVARFLVNVE